MDVDDISFSAMQVRNVNVYKAGPNKRHIIILL